MNERIDVLALQALDAKGGLDRHKFAELIIRECANAADMAQDAGCEYAGDYVAEYMGFGEQEGVTEWRAK